MHRAGWERPALGEKGLVTLHCAEQQSFQQIAFQRGLSGDAVRPLCQSLVVEDDGTGVRAGSAPGFGFIGIEEPIGALRGGWHVAPGNPRGTRLQIVIPVRGRGYGLAHQEKASAT